MPVFPSSRSLPLVFVTMGIEEVGPGASRASGDAVEPGGPDGIEIRRLDGVPRREGGSPETVLVFLHEGLGSVSHWGSFPERLCDRTGAGGWIYSRPGYGWSRPRKPPWPVDLFRIEAEETLTAVVAAIDAPRVVLFGHSDGATIALRYLAEQPDDRVAGAVLEAPHVFVEEYGLRSIRAADRGYVESGLARALSRHHRDVDMAFGGFVSLWLSPEFRSWEFEGLDRVDRPVLVIQGSEDEYGTMEHPRRIAAGVSGPVEVVELPGCGHAPHREAPEEVLSLTEVFLAGLS